MCQIVINYFAPVNNTGTQFSSPISSIQEELDEYASGRKEMCDNLLLKDSSSY